MKTITRAEIRGLIAEIYLKNLKEISNAELRKESDKFIAATVDLLVKGYHIRLKKVGWLGGSFKEGGRPVRNPKTGEKWVMHPTVSIKIRNKLQTVDRELRINASEVTEFYEKYGLSTDLIEAAYKALLHLITHEVMERGNRIEIRSLGVFKRTRREARIGRNPKTGERVHVAASYSLKFKPAKKMIIKAEENAGYYR